MAEASWKTDYVDALIRGDHGAASAYETVEFFYSAASEGGDGVSELLLHRTIARQESVEGVLNLLVAASSLGWNSYLPRILSRISEIDRTRAEYLDYVDYIDQALKCDDLHAPYSVRDWHLVTNDGSLKYDRNSVWSRHMTDVADILGTPPEEDITAKAVQQVLNFCFDSDLRIFQVAIVTFGSQNPGWAEALRSVFIVPNIHVRVMPTRALDEEEEYSPDTFWAPSWSLYMNDLQNHGWRYYERQTRVAVPGQGSKGLREQITILLALSGLLRDGNMLIPVESWSPFPPKSHPIWGFGDRQYVAGGTGLHAYDVRALALKFLERVPDSFSVCAFRSRLAAHFLTVPWKSRKSASILTSETGFFRDVVGIVKLFSANDFAGVIDRIEDSSYADQPLIGYFYHEATAGKLLLDEATTCRDTRHATTIEASQRVLCVAHASVPHQNGGYAVRAHGILKHLRSQGIDISAVTRPGFPKGIETNADMDVVDGVEYMRLPETGVDREEGEFQHMLTFVEPFERLFRRLGVGIIHVRSTYLISLPALIAARRLGLKVLYEVSGLWDLVYKDSESKSQLLKRSSFAQLAESVVMKNADHVVVMNDALKDIALARGAGRERISVAHNAVDTDVFQPVQGKPADICTIGYIGSFVNYEGLGHLVDAVKILAEQGSPVRLVAVGDGTQYGPIAKKVEKVGLSHLIELPGRVPHEEVMKYYRDIDIMVYPRVSTGTTEAITPLKPFEGLALGKPIIVSDVAPLREIVGDQTRGLTFQSGDIEDLATTIRRLAQDPDLQTSLGNAGRQWVVQNRNWNSVVKVFVSAFEMLDKE